MSTATPEQVLESIVTGINSGDLDSLMPLYESEAAFATEPGSLAHGAPGIREALNGFISMNGHARPRRDARPRGGRPRARDRRLVVRRHRARTASRCASRRRTPTSSAVRRDGTWRFVIDNPWGTD